MKKAINKDLYFYILNIYILMLILIPKSVSTIAGIIPLRLMLSVILLLVLFYFCYKKEIPLNNRSLRPYIILYLVFLVSAIPSFWITQNILISFYTLMKFIVFFCIFSFILKIDFSKKQYEILIKTFVFGILMVTIYGLIEYFFLPNLFKIGIEKYMGARGRVSATFFNTIYFGIFINLLFPFVLYIFSKSENKKTTLLYGLLSILMYISIVHTFTRSSFLIFFWMLFLMFVFMPKIFIKVKMVVLSIIVIFITIITPGSLELFRVSLCDGYSLIFSKFKSTAFEENLLQIKNSCGTKKNITTPLEDEGENTLSNSVKVDYSLVHRKEFSKIAKRIARDNILTGVGFGTYIDYMNSKVFDDKYPDYICSKTHPHSSLILIYSEIGIIGIISFSMFILYLFVINIISIFKTKEKRNVTILVSIIISGFILVNLIAENPVYDTQIYPLFLIIVGLSMNYIYNKKIKLNFN